MPVKSNRTNKEWSIKSLNPTLFITETENGFMLNRDLILWHVTVAIEWHSFVINCVHIKTTSKILPNDSNEKKSFLKNFLKIKLLYISL